MLKDNSVFSINNLGFVNIIEYVRAIAKVNIERIQYFSSVI